MPFPFDNIEYSYSSPKAEARACRKDTALFDFSFVLRVRLTGRNAATAVETFQRRPVRDMAVGRIRYSVKTDFNGAVRSDLTIWRIAENSFEVMTGQPADVDELLSLAGPDTVATNLSEDSAVLSLQGPGSLLALEGMADTRLLSALPYFQFTNARIGNVECLIGRLGYTGERGFEFIFRRSEKRTLWKQLSARSCASGYAAANILRIEAGFILFTQEGLIAPTVAELGMEHLFPYECETPQCRMVAFSAECSHQNPVWQPERSRIARPQPGQITITSTCFSPEFNQTIGLGFVSAPPASGDVCDPSGQFRNIRLQPVPMFDPGKVIPRQPWHATSRP